MAEEEKKAAVERRPRGRKPKTAEAVDAAAVAEESTVKRTTRGRKPKVAAQENVDTQATETGAAAAVPVAAEERTAKRTTRGRKPKAAAQKSVDTQATEAGAAAAAPATTEESTAKRTTRGRKPKVAAQENVDIQATEAGAAAPAATEESTAKRTTRGRKPKVAAQENVDIQATEAGAAAPAAAEESTVKRTTRARKPKTDEGAAVNPTTEEGAPKRITRVRKLKPEDADVKLAAAVAEAAQDRAAVSEAAAKEATQASTETLIDDTSGKEAAPARTEVVEKTDELDNETQKAPSGNPCGGILEVMPDGFGFTRSDNFMPGDSDVYVNPAIIKRYRLKTGDVIHGLSRAKNPNERYAALSYIETVNGKPLSEMFRRRSFESLTPIFPNQRIRLEVPGERSSTSLRILDLLAPIGKGQRGMIVSPPKAGKTTLLKQVAKAIVKNEPKMHLLILLIDERPEEVTDMKEEVEGGLVTVIYSTFDEVPEHHKRVAEMTIERAKRLVEQGEDVTILLDSITRLARAYNLVVPASGRTLSGGLDPAALHMPKRFFGAARNMREGGSLTILSTALVETGSRMDDVIYEEFKGTGNMELVLNRELQERRIFPAIDIVKSGTRRDDLLLSELEQRAVDIIHKRVSDEKASSAEEVIQLFERTSSNEEVCQFVVNGKPIPSTGARMNSGIRSNTNLSAGQKPGFNAGMKSGSGTGLNGNSGTKSGLNGNPGTKPGLSGNPATKTNGNPNSSTQKSGIKPGSNPNGRLAIKINR